jgi:hypothetical protein
MSNTRTPVLPPAVREQGRQIGLGKNGASERLSLALVGFAEPDHIAERWTPVSVRLPTQERFAWFFVWMACELGAVPWPKNSSPDTTLNESLYKKSGLSRAASM